MIKQFLQNAEESCVEKNSDQFFDINNMKEKKRTEALLKVIKANYD